MPSVQSLKLDTPSVKFYCTITFVLSVTTINIKQKDIQEYSKKRDSDYKQDNIYGRSRNSLNRSCMFILEITSVYISLYSACNVAVLLTGSVYCAKELLKGKP